MFCGECGVAVAPKLVEPATKPRPGDTAIIQPLELAPTEFLASAGSAGEVNGAPAARAEAARPSPTARAPRVRPKPVPPAPVAPASVAPASAAPASVAPASGAAAPASTAPVVADPVVPTPAPTHVSERAHITLPPKPVAPKPSAPRPLVPKAAPTAEPLPMPSAQTPGVAPAAASVAPVPPVPNTPTDPTSDDQHDLEETRIVAARLGDRFVLQFSTGENSTVYGTGLVGRNPVTQPGEYVDQLVTIVDPGKSVSKTHLEFGQTAGAFWVVDRYSANGTIVRQPDAPPQRLDPGKRQPVARGTRVDMGEQFFVVS